MRTEELGWKATVIRERVARRSRSARSDRTFGLFVALILIGIYLITYLRTGVLLWWLLAMAVVLAACAIVVPSVLSPLTRAWVALGRTLSRIVTPIFLGALYWLAIVPVRSIRKRSAAALAGGFDRNAASYWTARPADGDRTASQS